MLNAPDSFAATNAPESFPAIDPAYSTQKAAISPMIAMNAFTALAQLRPENALLVQESPSNSSDLVQAWPAEQPESYFTFSSGGLGWGAPAAVGIALAQKHNRTSRPTILAIGDGSLRTYISDPLSSLWYPNLSSETIPPPALFPTLRLLALKKTILTPKFAQNALSKASTLLFSTN